MITNIIDQSNTSALIIPEEQSDGDNTSVCYLFSIFQIIIQLIFFAKLKQFTIKQLEGVKIYSENLKLSFTAYVQDETTPSQQRCTIMTVHDLGCDRKRFKLFVIIS